MAFYIITTVQASRLLQLPGRDFSRFGWQKMSSIITGSVMKAFQCLFCFILLHQLAVIFACAHLFYNWTASCKTCLRAYAYSISAGTSAQSDQGLNCPMPESLDTTECINREQRPIRDLAHAQYDVKPHILLEGIFSLGAAQCQYCAHKVTSSILDVFA